MGLRESRNQLLPCKYLHKVGCAFLGKRDQSFHPRVTETCETSTEELQSHLGT